MLTAPNIKYKGIRKWVFGRSKGEVHSPAHIHPRDGGTSMVRNASFFLTHVKFGNVFHLPAPQLCLSVTWR